MRKRFLAVMLAGICVFTALAGCVKIQDAADGKSKANEESASTDTIDKEAENTDVTTVTVWVNGGEGHFIPLVKDIFEAAHPEIKLDLLYIPQGECYQKIMNVIATGGDLPDIVDVNANNIGQLKTFDLWEDLTAEPYGFDESQIIPYILETCKNDKGEVVTLQLDMNTCAVAYDRNLAKEYLGTDDPEELSAMFNTAQAYVDYGKQIAEKSGGSVYAFAAAQDAFNMMYATYTEEPFVIDNKLNIDNSIGEIYQFIEDLQKNGALDLYEQWSSEWVENISNSSTMFYACPMWFFQWGLLSNDSVGGGRWGIMNPPSPSTEGGEYFLIPKASDPDKKLAAYTFIEWFCATQEGTEAMQKTDGGITNYIGNLDKDNTYYSTSVEGFGGQDVYGMFVDIAKDEKTRVRPLTPFDQGIFDSSTALLADLAQGMSAAEALKLAKADIASKYPELTVE